MTAERILVIDDEPGVIRLCQRALGEEGFEVKGALSGEKGLQLLKGDGFDLTLLDVRLPDRDGLDVLSTIQEMDPEMAVVIITGHGTMEVAIRALKSGPQDFLLKPFTPEELVTSVQKVLERERLTQENLRLKARLPILEISNALMSEVNLERLAQLALETVKQALGADRVSLMFLNEDRQELSILAALGLPDDVVTTTRVKMGQGLAGLAVRKREPILLPEHADNDPAIQTLLPRNDTGQSPEPVEGSAICMPLILKDRALGVLNASRVLDGASFRQDDVDLLSILGGQIAVAIENARLFEQAQQEIAERKRADEELKRHRDHLEELVEERTAELITAIEQLEQEITERKRMEEALRLAHRELAAKAAELEEANAELSQYAYVVSHDVRAPLRAIHNYADFLQEDLEATLDGDQKAYLDGLRRAVHEAEALVGDLLELSRIGQRSVSIETVDVGAFLRELVASLDLPAEVEIVMADEWPTVDVEPVLLRQIFQNLIDNAVKFNDSPRKRVEFGWRPAGKERYELFVRDNGIGIDPRYHEQIFRVFERLHTREEYEGTGIGLAIVKKATSKLRGSVRLESKPGEGSTFFVTLPKTQ